MAKLKSTKSSIQPTCATCPHGTATLSGVDCHAPIPVGAFYIDKSDDGYEFLPPTFACNQHPKWGAQ